MQRRRFLPLLIAPGLASGCRASDALHSSMGPPLNTLRILCLHGYHGSADILRRQMAALIDGLDDVAQFVCVDAPSLAAGDFGWWHAKASPDSPDHDDVGVDARSRHYQGWQRTRDGIVSLFAQHGPFDGVFGFSQGAALTGLLVGLRAPDGHASAARPLVFDFAAMVGGFPAADPALATLYDETTSYGLPSVHIIGRADSIVPAGVSRALASRFANPLVLEHAGGHVIASTPEIRARFRAFLEAMLELRDKRAPQPAAPAPPPRPLPATLELPLWPGRAHPSMRLHFPPNAGTDKARPAMLVFAGGAYASCNGSGHDSAEWLSRQGMVGISVEYTTRSTGGAYPANFS